MMRFLKSLLSSSAPKPPTAPTSPQKRQPPPEAIEEAKTKPNGWVYEIIAGYGPNDDVPGEAVRGAWKVDERGTIVGDFTPNPNFNPKATPPKNNSTSA